MDIPPHISTCKGVDKSGWATHERPSPWVDEPDAAWWTDPATGLLCIAVRAPIDGHWRGHVGVRAPHPLFQTERQDILGELTVYGGVSLFGGCSSGTAGDHCYGLDDRPLCHETEPGDITWLGFEANQLRDIMPGHEARLRDSGSLLPPERPGEREYRTLEFMIQQCTELARQLGALDKDDPKRGGGAGRASRA